ncbi:hypothetical protein E3N88_35622 [Mikania micrantha]|uniref:Uncharacterized protein n=1 Tax=Mikania micrantha TaxID=192012 RepID=A0A5N6M1T9_9ASTR|nr:hypothetical protein E3N88_35622 [Mikania micrantha]
MKKKTSNTTPAIVDTITKSKKRTRQLKPKDEPVFTIGDIEDIQFRKDEVADIRASLLKWYDVNQRDLPWRRINQSDVNDDDEILRSIVKRDEVWTANSGTLKPINRELDHLTSPAPPELGKRK